MLSLEVLDVYNLPHTLTENNLIKLSNSYTCTMACPNVRGDNPRALASGISYEQVDNYGISIPPTSVHF